MIVMEFSKTIFYAWKLLENDIKVMDFYKWQIINRKVKPVIQYA